MARGGLAASSPLVCVLGVLLRGGVRSGRARQGAHSALRCYFWVRAARQLTSPLRRSPLRFVCRCAAAPRSEAAT